MKTRQLRDLEVSPVGVVVATKLHLGSGEAVQEKNLYDVIRQHLDASMEKLQTD